MSSLSIRLDHGLHSFRILGGSIAIDSCGLAFLLSRDLLGLLGGLQVADLAHQELDAGLVLLNGPDHIITISLVQLVDQHWEPVGLRKGLEGGLGRARQLPLFGGRREAGGVAIGLVGVLLDEMYRVITYELE